jgi:hypothetical protein
VVRALKVASGPRDALGRGATAVKQHQKSAATTTTGKVVDSGLAGNAWPRSTIAQERANMGRYSRPPGNAGDFWAAMGVVGGVTQG